MNKWTKPMINRDFMIQAAFVGAMLLPVIFAWIYAMSMRENTSGYSYLDKTSYTMAPRAAEGENS